MRLIIIGCEYVGKTTLAEEISKWMQKAMGPARIVWHDHFVVPYLSEPSPNSEEEAEQILTLKPSLLEKFQRYMLEYHLSPAFYQRSDHLLINWYYADAVYAPLYYGYGGPDNPPFDRRRLARLWDAQVVAVAPDTILVLMEASADVIRERKRQNPHPRCILKDQDVEFVLDRFKEEYSYSLLRRRFTLDTTNASVEEIFEESLRKMRPHFTQADRLRILSHQAL